jgi:flavin-dependent dehydrogenase
LKGVRFPFGAHTADHLFEPDLPYGYAWVFPDVEGISNVGVYLTQDAYREQGHSLATLLQTFLARHPDRFADAEQVGRARTWSLPLAPLRTRASAPGLLVAGDAGYFIDPLSGEGIWQALYTGMLAGRVTADALRGAGQLTARHRARYDLGCARHIGLPSFAKAGVQSAMRFLVANDLYKLAPVRAGLRAGYRGNLFEISRAND